MPNSTLLRNAAIRNVAIIAHVDHGKTTLVDALLKQSRIFRENQQVGSLILDSNELEREKGITILAKNTAIEYRGVKINIIDTPGHADFSGEVERVLNMADGCLLLVDAVEGPMPQTRYVLKKAFETGLRPIVVVNKMDRANARPAEVLGATQDLFLDLASEAEQLEFPVLYANARAGIAATDPRLPERGDLSDLFEAILASVPPPNGDADEPFQLLVTALDYDPHLGRIAIGRIRRGVARAGMPVVRIDHAGTESRARLVKVLTHRGLGREEVEAACAGDIVALCGVEGVTIGDTLADPARPEALPPIAVEPPTLKMTFGVNTSPFAGKEGRWGTSRQLRERLYRELETNVALRVRDTESADVFEVSGRGELHLAILIETMRREGYEFQVSRPEVITRHIDGRLHEPVEQVVIETRDAHVGVVTELMGKRFGQLTNMQPASTGDIRLEFKVPTRGLIGFRNTFLTLTRGEGTMGSVVAGWEPWYGELPQTRHGALIASEPGVAVTYGLHNAQARGITFIEPGTQVYTGMIVGLHARPGDLQINVCKEKKKTNVRASVEEIQERLTPATKLSLEQALDFIQDDELVEVTPAAVRLRKRYLTQQERELARKAIR